MRRQIRCLLNGLWLLSLLVCLASAWLWARSYGSGDRLSIRIGRDRYTLRSRGGSVAVFGPPRRPAPNPAREQRLVKRLVNERLGWAVQGLPGSK